MKWPLMILWLTICLQITAVTAQKSYSLDEAIAYALKHHTAMELAQLDIKAAESRIQETKSIGMPQINAGVDYNYYFQAPINPVEDFITPSVYSILVEEFPNEVTFPTSEFETFEFSIFTKHNLSARIDGSMLLFDGSYLTGVKAAKVFKDLTAQDLAVQEEEIKAAVTKAYMNILIYEENLKTLANNTQNVNAALKEAQAYYKNGFMEQLDIDRISLSLENINIQTQKLEQVKEISYNMLKYQMHYPANDELTLSEDIDALILKLSAQEVETLENIDYANKAEYGKILMGQELNKLNLERYKKGFLPSLRARAGVSEAIQRNNLFDKNEAGWLPTVYAGLALNIPITDGKQKKSKIQQTKLEIEKTNILQEEYKRGLELQIQNHFRSYQNAQATLANTKKSLDLVQSIYDKTLIKFKEGVGSSIEVTQAESQLFDAQANYIDALYDLLITKTDLDIALGNI